MMATQDSGPYSATGQLPSRTRLFPLSQIASFDWQCQLNARHYLDI